MFKKEVKGVQRIQIRSSHANVVMYAVFETTVSKEALEKAVPSLSNKHQLLNCRIETDKQNKVWFVINKKLLPQVTTSKSKNINDVVIDELKHRFDLERGPLIKFTLLNPTTLIINCHHAICDGLSFIYLFKDIISVLSGKSLETEQKKSVFLEPENIPQKLGNPVSRFFIDLINTKWNRQPVSFSDQLYRAMHTKFWKEYKPQIIQFKFSKEETANIISQCKQNNISVNTGLVTAFLCAEKQLLKQKDNSSKVIITVNLRDYLKEHPGESMGYFISTLKPYLEYVKKKAFWENAQIFHKKINQLLEKGLLKNQVFTLFSPKFLDVVMLNFLGQRDDKLAKKIIKKAGINKNTATFTIANLGLIKSADNLDKLKIKSLFGPFALSDAMEKYISVLTINNQLHFSICFNENTIDRESILKIKEFVPKVFEDSSV